MIDYYVHFAPLPHGVEGVSVPNDDGSFDVYINSALSTERRRETLEHELKHLEREHFYVDLSIGQMERQAEGEQVNVVLHPPEGKLPCFYSEQSFAHWLGTVCRQQHMELSEFYKGNKQK